ncbi:MAG: VWA domain-containing protein, partial [Anaerolineales bacterium]|nr:VWA domain-containing protein [Anaerolineales bacterium]
PVVRITQVDTSRFPLVTVYISVTDANGQPLPVSPGSLVILENGKPVEAQLMQGSGEAGPITTLLLMDTSGSMATGKKLIWAKRVAREFIDRMRPGDQTGILAFNTDLTLAQAVTVDTNALSNAIDKLVARSDTAMYDALVKGEEILADVPGRKAIVALTDGMDNRSSVGAADVIGKIAASGLTISTIGLGDANQTSGSQTALDEKALKYLAENSGGLYSFAKDPEALAGIYELYQRGLQSEYAVTYTSPSSLRDGLNRVLSVSLSEQAAAVPEKYNPGGLVPEVGQPASWGAFLAMLGVLVLLLFVPTIVREVRIRRGTSSGMSSKGAELSGKVKLKEAPPKRIKLK